MKRTLNTILKWKQILGLVLFMYMPYVGDAQVRIACIGNSITYGANLNNPSEESYPSQLSQLLNEKYKGACEVQNFGLSGRNMLKKGPTPIWKESRFQEALMWAPDICIILLGTNDSPPYLWNEFGDEFPTDYLAMIDTFKRCNPDVNYLIGVPTPIWKGHRYGGHVWATKHNDSILINDIIPIIEEVAVKTGATLVDFYTPFLDRVELFPDRLHPNAAGAKIMAKLIFDTLENNAYITDQKGAGGLKN